MKKLGKQIPRGRGTGYIAYRDGAVYGLSIGDHVTVFTDDNDTLFTGTIVEFRNYASEPNPVWRALIVNGGTGTTETQAENYGAFRHVVAPLQSVRLSTP